MPANLTPQYLEAERVFKAAKEPDAKLAALDDMIRLLPKHKGTDRMLAGLRRKRSELVDECEKAKVKGRRGPSFRIPPEGGGQAALVGAPNAGKSSLLRALTKATPEVGDFPFTTREPVPGMMAYEDIAFQLIDTPPITADFMFPWMVEICRNADAALFVADLSTDDALEHAAVVRARLAEKKVELVPQAPRESGAPVKRLRTLLVGNKADAAEAIDRFDVLAELLGEDYRRIAVSALTGQGLPELRALLFDFMEVIRVYSKMPGKKPDMDAPFVLPRDSTVMDLARKVHRDIAERLKSARLWGEGVFEGQTVKRDHVLHDGDVVELHD